VSHAHTYVCACARVCACSGAQNFSTLFRLCACLSCMRLSERGQKAEAILRLWWQH
jgi:hypothetical protein